MQCYKCRKTAKIAYQNGDLCGNCFIEMLVTRIRKHIRQENPFERGQKVLVFGKLAAEFLKRAVEGMPLKISEAKKSFSPAAAEENFARYDKIVVPWTADDEANQFFEAVMSSKLQKSAAKHKQNNKIVKIFRPVLDSELNEASKILKIKFIPLPKQEIIEKISRKYGSSMFGLSKTASEFRKAVK